MEGYSVVETALVNLINQHFADEFNNQDMCVAGNISTLMDRFATTGGVFGCIIEYGGGRLDRGTPFSKDMWMWQPVGVFLVRFTTEDEVEANLRKAIDKLSTLFSEDKRLGGLSPLARVTNIESAEPVQLGDMPFYWMPFDVVIYDRD